MGDAVLWSGGFDSTLVLAQRAKHSSRENPVLAVSVKHQELGDDKWLLEQKAREKLLEVFKKRGYYVKHYIIEIKAHESGNPNNWLVSKRGESLYQPAWWLCYFLDFLKEGDKLYLGYHQSDGFWVLNQHYIETFQNACKLMGKKCELHFPLKIWNKERIIREIKKENLLNLCWTCETPKKEKPCNECESCNDLRITLGEIKRKDRILKAKGKI